MFKIFGSKSNAVWPGQLPQMNTFIDAIVDGRHARSVSVESVGAQGIVTREALGAAGEPAVLVYNAPAGRFRAETKIASVSAANTQFALPHDVRLIGAAMGPQKRQSVRLDAVVPGQWRLAPRGVGVGEFLRANIRDISRGGCALIVDRVLKVGAEVELHISLRSEGQPLTVLATVVRYDQHIEASGKHSHGMRFHGLRAEEDQAIITFINHRQADRRSRGLA
jgi:hypothetical protein